VLIAGIMEHIEEAGVHSGDSSCVLPPQGLSSAVLATIQDYTERLARALQRHRFDERPVRGQGRQGLRAGSESAGVAHRSVRQQSHRRALPKIAVGLMLGKKLADFDRPAAAHPAFCRAAVLREIAGVPVRKFPGVDPALGPEMRSTGEVMGVGENFGEAFAKAQLGAGTPCPTAAWCFISVNDRDKAAAVAWPRFAEHGFRDGRHARHRRRDESRGLK
jgi:carbamoyl-phosphate synthase large subunit